MSNDAITWASAPAAKAQVYGELFEIELVSIWQVVEVVEKVVHAACTAYHNDDSAQQSGNTD